MGFLIKRWEPQGHIKPQPRKLPLYRLLTLIHKDIKKKKLFVEDRDLIQNYLMKILIHLTTF